MNVTQVRRLFDQFSDEVDRTFVDDTSARDALSRAYAEFRRVVTRGDPWFYVTSVDLVLNGASYDLATGVPSVLGASPTATKMFRENALELLNAAGESKGLFTPADAVQDVMLPWSTTPMQVVGHYMIRNRVLLLDRAVQATVRLWYVPFHTVDWTKDTSGDNEYIDDLDDSFHELIALIAVHAYYNLRDSAEWELLRVRMETLKGELHQHLVGGRQMGGGVAADSFFGW